MNIKYDYLLQPTLCSARFALVNVCVNALESRNVKGMLLQPRVCANPHPRECTYQRQRCLTKRMAAGDYWKIMIQRCVVTQADRWCVRFRAEDCLFRWPEPPSPIFTGLLLPQTRFPLISPPSDLLCAIIEEWGLRGQGTCGSQVLCYAPAWFYHLLTRLNYHRTES